MSKSTLQLNQPYISAINFDRQWVADITDAYSEPCETSKMEP